MSGHNKGIIEKIFEKIHRLEPSEQSEEKAIQKVRERLLESENEKANAAFNAARIIMRSPITKFSAAAVIIIVIFVCIHQFGGSIDGTSLAWADVIEKLENDIKSANTIHVFLTMRMPETEQSKPGEVEAVEPGIIKGELWLRRNPFKGKFVLGGEQTVYFTENKATTLDHHGKKWFERPVLKDSTKAYLYIFDPFVTGDFLTRLNVIGYTISDTKPVGHETVAGEKTKVYEFTFKPVRKNGVDTNTKRSLAFKYWIRNSDNRVVRLHEYFIDIDQDVPFMSFDLIEYNVDVPAGTFDVIIPEGYVKQLTPEETIRMTVPEDIIELKRAYDKARENFPDYRMMVFDSSGNIESRTAKDGEKWRVDTYRQDIKDTGIFDMNSPPCFNDLWNQIEALQSRIERTVMSYKSGSARVFWPRENVGGLPRTLYQERVGFSYIMNTLEYLTWPQMSLIGPNSKIELLPPSDKHQGCVGVCYSQITKERKSLPHHPQIAMLTIFWIDPSRDYICIRYERHQRPKAVWEEDKQWEQHEPNKPRVDIHDVNGVFYSELVYFHSDIIEITEPAQTANGKWYPKVIKTQHYSVNRDGTRVTPSPKPKIKTIHIDTQGPIDPNLFEWPAEFPPPSN